MSSSLTAGFTILLIASGPLDDASTPVIGHWVGTLDPGPVELTLVLRVEEADDGTLTATLDSPDQAAFDIPAESVEFESRALRFACPSIDARFEGTLAQGDSRIEGVFTQRGRETPLTIERTKPEDLPKPVEAPAELQGIWQGPIELPGGLELRIAFRVLPDENRDGAFKAVMDSLDQGARGIPVSAASLDDEGRVRFEVKAIAGRFEGRWDNERKQIEGTWSQLGRSYPLTLEFREKETVPNRPQHPEPPFPYEVEEVTFENPEAGVTLAGTLTLPEGEAPFPAAVLLSGSGPQDRDESLMGHKPFLVLADHLTRNGLAVLRFDDRGVGASTGDHGAATTADFASDALAAARFLGGRPEIDAERISLIGHSEGAITAPMAAVRAPDAVHALVLLAPPAVPGRDIILHQQELIARAYGEANEDEIARQTQKTKELLELAEAAPELPPEELERRLKALTSEILPLSDDGDTNIKEDELEAMLQPSFEGVQSPWFRYFVQLDPATVFERVSCPVLALFGGRDLQVDPAQNRAPLEAALERAPTDQFEVHVLDGLNHLFQHAETGSPIEYAQIEETFAPEALERVADWLHGLEHNKDSDKQQ